jgi:hypothetical protein
VGFFDFLTGGAAGKRAFAKAVMEHLRHRGETRALQFDEAAFLLRIGTGTGEAVNVLNLGNAWEEYNTLPKGDRERVIERFASPAFIQPQGFSQLEQVRASLLPRVRDRLFVSLLGVRARRQLGADFKAGDAVPQLPHRPLAGVLATSLCIDLPTAVADCLDHHFTGWKASFDELFPVALENLRSLSQAPFTRVAPGVYVSPFRDSHDPARLLLPQLLQGLDVKGALVAGIPNRDTLLVTGANDQAGLEEFVSLMKMGLKDPRPLCSAPLVLEDDGWAVFEPAFEGPLAGELRTLSASVWVEQYATQKAELEAEFERVGREVFVATYKAYRTPEGRVCSAGSWTKGVPTLLPKTDELMLAVVTEDEGAEPVLTRASWDTVARVCGARLVKEEGLWPERWLVTSFPSDDELAAIQVASSVVVRDNLPGRAH